MYLQYFSDKSAQNTCLLMSALLCCDTPCCNFEEGDCRVPGREKEGWWGGLWCEETVRESGGDPVSG